MTPTQVQVLLAVLAFIFGLISKIVFDLWEDRRKKQSLIITKKLLSAFSINMLGEQLTEKTQLYFSGEPVDSIQIIELEIENTGSRAVKNQAFTVRFDEKARILGKPVSKSHTEDARFAHGEKIGNKDNLYRFNVQLLQKAHRLTWEFAVVDNASRDFVVEHGIFAEPEDLTNVDLDVSSVVASSKAQLDLIAQIKRFFVILFVIIAVYFLRDITALLNLKQLPVVLGITLIFLLFFLSRSLLAATSLWIESKQRGKGTRNADYIYDFESVHAGMNFVGRDMYNIFPPLRELSKEMVQELEKVYKYIAEELGEEDLNKKGLITDTIVRIIEEIKKGAYADLQFFSNSLKLLRKESQEIYLMIIDVIKVDIANMPSAIQDVVRAINEEPE